MIIMMSLIRGSSESSHTITSEAKRCCEADSSGRGTDEERALSCRFPVRSSRFPDPLRVLCLCCVRRHISAPKMTLK